MAYTATVIEKTVFGNLRTVIYDVTADAASGVVDAGMNIVGFAVGPVSMATVSLVKFRPNIGADSAAANGKLMVSGAASGDRFFLTIYGH
jgi:hypothetical protein